MLQQLRGDAVFLASCSSAPAGTLRVGYEVLEGSPEDGAFRTPLATLHKCSGWTAYGF